MVVESSSEDQIFKCLSTDTFQEGSIYRKLENVLF